jgi:Ca-activated chloride channel family protein
VVSKDVLLVLDISGSMHGPKIEQAKKALDYVLDHLNPGDRFNVIAFSTGTVPYASSLQSLAQRADAEKFVGRLAAEGSTDINRALLEALADVDNSRPATIIFLTDGLPTTGEIDSQKIIGNVSNAAPKNVRLFTFGVGDDVNTILLDTLAEKLRGASGYVRPNEGIDEVVSAFYAQVSTPVLSDLTIDWGGAAVSDVYPYPQPDLFAGTQLVVAGRYHNAGPAAITLKGMVNGETKTFKYTDVTFNDIRSDDRSSGSAADFVPRLWATRKIGYLLNQIRLSGESKEVVNEIVTLAVRYGIVTPYTSFLVDDRADVLTQSGRSDAAQEMQKSFAPSAMPATGAGAVQQSQQQNQLRGAAAAPTAAPQPASPGGTEQVTPIQMVGDKTFLLRDGVWVDTQFDPSKMSARKIEFNSDAYYAWVANNPASSQYLALGQRVIVVLGDTPYEITNNGSGSLDPAAVPTANPSPTASSGGVGGWPSPQPATPIISGASSRPSILLLIGGGMLAFGLVVTGLVTAMIAFRQR